MPGNCRDAPEKAEREASRLAETRSLIRRSTLFSRGLRDGRCDEADQTPSELQGEVLVGFQCVCVPSQGALTCS